MGTPDYMPPEQALGKTAHVDQRGDQYSLAVIVYEMLAGRGPFQGDMMAILSQVATSEPPPIEGFVRGLPPGVGPVLRRAMAKVPTDRFETIIDFANALSAAASAPLHSPSAPLVIAPKARATLRLATPSALSEPPVASRTHESNAAAPRLVSPPPGAASQSMLLKTLEIAKKARSARDIELSAVLAERALSIADTLGTGAANAAIEHEEALIESSLELRLGPRTGVLHAVPAPNEHTALLPEEAFLLSRIDGIASVEEVLDLSPLPRIRTLRLLVRMLRQHLINNG
jgi:serine/threonine protein kinase